jgi:hypothetical protein
MELIHERQKPPSAWRSAVEAVPVVGDSLAIARLNELWRAIDETMANRANVNRDELTNGQRELLRTFIDLAQRSVGWREPNFDLRDDVGVLLWSPADLLAGMQVLIELEERYELPPGSLSWEDWEAKQLSELLGYLDERA